MKIRQIIPFGSELMAIGEDGTVWISNGRLKEWLPMGLKFPVEEVFSLPDINSVWYRDGHAYIVKTILHKEYHHGKGDVLIHYSGIDGKDWYIEANKWPGNLIPV